MTEMLAFPTWNHSCMCYDGDTEVGVGIDACVYAYMRGCLV